MDGRNEKGRTVRAARADALRAVRLGVRVGEEVREAAVPLIAVASLPHRRTSPHNPSYRQHRNVPLYSTRRRILLSELKPALHS